MCLCGFERHTEEEEYKACSERDHDDEDDDGKIKLLHR